MLKTPAVKVRDLANVATLAIGLMVGGCGKEQSSLPERPTSPTHTAAAKLAPIVFLSQAHWSGPQSNQKDFEHVVVPSQNNNLQWMRHHTNQVYFVEGLFGDLPIRREHLNLFPRKLERLLSYFPEPHKVDFDNLTMQEQIGVAQIGAAWVALYGGIVGEFYPTITATERDVLNQRQAELRDFNQTSHNAGLDSATTMSEYNKNYDAFLALHEEFVINKIERYSANALRRTGSSPTNIALVIGDLHRTGFTNRGVSLIVPNDLAPVIRTKE